MDKASGGEEDKKANTAGIQKQKGREKERGRKWFLEGRIECVTMLDESTSVSEGGNG